MLMNEDASTTGDQVASVNDNEPARIGHPLFRERWGNDLAFRIGLYAGQGLTSTSICDRVGDGIRPSSVTAMLHHWGHKLPSDQKRGYAPITLHLCAKDRTRLDAEAAARGITMPQLCERLLSMAARDQLFGAVLDE